MQDQSHVIETEVVTDNQNLLGSGVVQNPLPLDNPQATFQTVSQPLSSSSIESNNSITSSPLNTNVTSPSSKSSTVSLIPSVISKKTDDDMEFPAYLKWKEQHEQELKEKAKNAEERQLRARERAKQELQEFMEQRTKEIQSRKILNREKEAAFLKSREAVRSEDRVWEHVSHLIESIAKDLASTSPSSKRTAESDTVESNNNTNLNTSDQKLRVVKKDTTRMRELLRVPPSTSTATLS